MHIQHEAFVKVKTGNLENNLVLEFRKVGMRSLISLLSIITSLLEFFSIVLFFTTPLVKVSNYKINDIILQLQS